MVNSPNAEMDPDLSGRFLLFTRSRLVGEGREEAEITEVLLYNRNTRTLRLLSRARNRFFFVGTQHHSLAAGQINGAYAVWTRYTHGLDSIERSAVVLHNIQTGTTTTLPQPRRTYQDGPGVATDGTVYYTRLIKTRTGGGIGPVGWVLEQPIGAPAEVVFTFDALTEGAGGFYVDERANERHIYFGFRHGRGGFSDIYKVVEPTP